MYYKYSDYKKQVDLKKLDFVIRTVRSHFADTSGITGLDVGCGQGNASIPLAAMGCGVKAFDISLADIATAKEKQKRYPEIINFPDFMHGDAENLQLENLAFDFVICLDVLYFLNNPSKAMGAISSAIKPQGILVVGVQNGYGPYAIVGNPLIAKCIKQTFTFNSFTGLLCKYGFRVTEHINSDFISGLPVLVKSKLISRLDCRLADKIPPWLASGWYVACIKEN